jgi:hypothetical protein
VYTRALFSDAHVEARSQNDEGGEGDAAVMEEVSRAMFCAGGGTFPPDMMKTEELNTVPMQEERKRKDVKRP